MTGWRRVLRLSIGVVLAVTVYFLVPVDLGGENLAFRFVLTLSIIVMLTAGIIWQVVRHIEQPELRVDGLVFAIVVAVLTFALAYYRIEKADPGQFADLNTRLDSLYFALSTLLTVGFGDVHAVGQTARGLVSLAMVFNVLVIATAVSTLSNAVRRRAQERLAERRQNLPAPQDPSAAQDPAPARRTHRKPR